MMAIKLRNTISNLSAGTTTMTLNVNCEVGDTIILSFWCRDKDFNISDGWNLVFKYDLTASDGAIHPTGTFYKIASSSNETVTITQNNGRMMMCLSAFYSDSEATIEVVDDVASFQCAGNDAITPTLNFTRNDSYASVFNATAITWVSGSGSWTTNPNDLKNLLTVTGDRCGVYFDDGTASEKRTFSPLSTTSKNYAFTRTMLLEKAYERRYLLSSNDTYYTIADDELLEVEIPELNAQAFLDFGFTDIPSSDILKTLVNPKVLFWQESEEHDLPVLQADITAIPPVQILEHSVDMNHVTIKSIKSIETDFVGAPSISFSKDGQTWQQYNGDEWVDGYGQIETHTGEVLESWRSGAKNFKIRIQLHENDALKYFKINYEV